MNYPETLDYLYHSLPMFSRMGSAAYKKDLTNIIALCTHLQQPQQHFRTVHIGGTNGKGSVSHMLAAVLQTAGYRTGLYTSPHLKDFRERIRVDGALIGKDFVVDFVHAIRPLIEELKPSFFEITVAMAFRYFVQQQVDVAVIEVGLGGRLDSTNIIRPELSVITNIGWDHMNLLGHTLEAIAAEKAGIIKKETPVVIGERQPATEPVFRQAAGQLDAPLYFAEDHFSIERYQLESDRIRITVRNRQGATTTYELDLPGIYQTKNLVTVLQALQVLQQKGYVIRAEHVATALARTRKSTGLHGRWEVIRQQPMTVLEVAHNEDGVRQMLQHLQELAFGQLHLVIGMVKDKEVEKVLALLPPTATYYFTQAQIPRALEAGNLMELARPYGLNGQAYPEVNEALKAALHAAGKNDLVLVCGSIFLVAEVDQEASVRDLA